MSVTTDNSLPMGTTNCIVVVAQPVVSDGCYVPEQLAAAPPSSSSTSQTTTPPPPSSLIQSTSSSSSVSSVTWTSSTTQVASPTVTGQLRGSQLTIGDIIAIISGVIGAIGLGIIIYECNRRRRAKKKRRMNDRFVFSASNHQFRVIMVSTVTGYAPCRTLGDTRYHLTVTALRQATQLRTVRCTIRRRQIELRD